MPCIEGVRSWPGLSAALMALLLAGCASRPHAPVAPVPTAVAAPDPATAPDPRAETVSGGPAKPDTAAERTQPTSPNVPNVPAEPAAGHPKAPPRYVKLGPPKPVRSWDELRLQVAQRLVAAHPDTTYVGTPPPILLAVPILEIELDADGSVRHIRVLRVPGAAEDTTDLAIAAVLRAAPYGDVSRLKKPWKFVETFLFDDDRRFMPRTLDR